MIHVRRSQDRGHADYGWLKTYHSFSFADYYDPKFMGFRDLRVINEDYIGAGAGFPTHPHRDMEIITWVVSGALEHQDTLGNKTKILPGELQRMSAGTGIQHSEYNASPNESTHLLQIWIQPNRRGVAPSYGQKSFAAELSRGGLVLVASGDGRAGSVTIEQDVKLHAAHWGGPQRAKLDLDSTRYGWVQVIDGPIFVNGVELGSGDGAALVEEAQLEIDAQGKASFLFFDLA